MNFSHRPNRVLRVRPALRRGHQQVLGQRLEVEPAIEAVGEGAKILRCIFCGIGFVATDKGTHNFCVQQSHHMAEFAKFAGPVVRTTTGLNRNQARDEVGKVFNTYLAMADKALYLAKENGRHRVELAQLGST